MTKNQQYVLRVYTLGSLDPMFHVMHSDQQRGDVWRFAVNEAFIFNSLKGAELKRDALGRNTVAILTLQEAIEEERKGNSGITSSLEPGWVDKHAISKEELAK